MENVLDLRIKLINKVIMEWIESIENSSPEEICMKMEELREELRKGA